jgi:hypothetical protein
MVDMLPVFTSTNETVNSKALQIFPNPIVIEETLNLMDLPDGEKQISVFHNLGQRIFFEKLMQRNMLFKVKTGEQAFILF